MNEIVKSEVEISPQKTIIRGQEMADALKSIVMSKKGGLVIKGERYLEFEDWQTLGKFFSYSVKTFDAQFIEVDGVKGAKAKAEVIDNKTGLVIGSAEAYCLRDEENWKNKPFFQIASMAQTRAGSKALRNVLAWVAVLAGYKPTPAEEIIEVEEPIEKHIEKPIDNLADKPTIKNPSDRASDKQIGLLHKICKTKNFDYDYLKKILDIEHGTELNKGAAGNLIVYLQKVDELTEEGVKNAVGTDYIYEEGEE